MKKSYIGRETKKAATNFQITNQPISIDLMYALAHVKAACALANKKAKVITPEIADTIVTVCNEILAGTHNSSFITDSIQGGAGTSINMNINELIALRGSEILQANETTSAENKDSNSTQFSPADLIHPLDHVNASQSTNDTVPTAFRIALIWKLDSYIDQLTQTSTTLSKQAKKYADVQKVGRTHLQDAVPVTVGQEMQAWVSFLRRDIARLKDVQRQLCITNLGGTAIGTSLGAKQAYVAKVHEILQERVGLPMRAAADLIDATQNVDTFILVSQLLELSALSFSKIISDIRLMTSGPRAGLQELTLPAMQKGSTIMAGKVNPVQLEAYNQVAFAVSGNAQTARLVLLHGQFELNVMLPVFISGTLHSLSYVTQALQGLQSVFEQMAPNTSRCQDLVETSMCLAPELNERVGYDKAGDLVQQALREQKTLRQVAREHGIELL